MIDSERELERIFLSYNKILKKLKLQGITTKNNKEITHKDLRQAVSIMQRKHPNCRWQSNKVKSKKYFILMEGYLWIMLVYFQKEKSIIDADIDFFKTRIVEYEKVLNIKTKSLFNEDILYNELENFFDRKLDTIRKAINKLEKKYNINLRFEKNNQIYVCSMGIELLCEQYFKQKYLQILEDYKMELTEKYIEAGFPYDYFFHRN